MELQISADFSEFQRKLDWISSLLESRDVREGLDQILLDRLKDVVAGVGSEEIAKFGAVVASAAGNLVIKIVDGRLLEDVTLALEALGFKFHGDPSYLID